MEAILIVDDEAIILLALKNDLKQYFGEKYSIETALSAEEGFGVIDDLSANGVKIIVIISDWLMPGMKGDEFLIKVKRSNPDIITIMITGHADAEAITRAKMEAGLAACINKPWSSEQLFTVISRAIADIHATGTP